MKEHSILCTGDEVRAIRAGRKTQTRRVIDKISRIGRVTEFGKSDCPGYDWTFRNRRMLWNDLRHAELMKRCPYGVPGDKLKVRETFCIETNFDIGSGYQPPFTDGRPVRWIENEDFGGTYWEQCHYRATDPTPELDIGGSEPGVRWCPSTNMPRWACRLVLDVTDVRVERVQDISEVDAIAEGFDMETCASVLNKAAGKLEPLDACWLTSKDGEEYESGGYWCTDCANKLADEHGLDIDGDWGSPHETDGPATCEECDAPLMVALSESGISRELFLENTGDDCRQYYAATGGDAAIAAMIADGIGDLKDRQKGRLAQIGFATYWDSIAKPGDKFADNPWVFVRSFDVVETPGR